MPVETGNVVVRNLRLKRDPGRLRPHWSSQIRLNTRDQQKRSYSRWNALRLRRRSVSIKHWQNEVKSSRIHNRPLAIAAKKKLNFHVSPRALLVCPFFLPLLQCRVLIESSWMVYIHGRTASSGVYSAIHSSRVSICSCVELWERFARWKRWNIAWRSPQWPSRSPV